MRIRSAVMMTMPRICYEEQRHDVVAIVADGDEKS